MGDLRAVRSGVPEATEARGFESTAALIDRVRCGDSDAREELAARYLPVLQRWAHGRLPARARTLWETNDLVQVTLLRALDRLESFEPRREGAFLAYLRTALMNVMRNEIRRSAQDPRSSLPENLASGDASIMEEIMGREVLDAYEAGLSALPARVREALILRLEFGYSYGEIAEATGSPSTDAARMAVGRGMVRLSAAMDAHR